MGFIRMCIANFFLFASIYMLFPVLPVVMGQRLDISIAQASYMFLAFAVGMFAVGPFHSYLGDHYKRKRVLLYSVFVMLAATMGYRVVGSYLELLGLAAIQGGCFSLATTAGITVAIDITTSFRRSPGNMAHALAARLGMLAGVGVGYWIYLSEDFQTLLYISVACGLVCMWFAGRVYVPFRAPIGISRCNLDRFLLLRGWLPAVDLVLVAFIPGMLIPLLGQGDFSSLLLLFILALLTIPYIRMFVKLSQHCQRGTANTTCHLSMETGILVGMIIAYHLLEKLPVWKIYQYEAIIAVIALLFFFLLVYPYYKKKKVR